MFAKSIKHAMFFLSFWFAMFAAFRFENPNLKKVPENQVFGFQKSSKSEHI